ncbi:MAG: hypothetical protein KAI79_17560 [Bacteroidales bacterium]|nr:hypothetical protein [Bacteroidales bacterium]
MKYKLLAVALLGAILMTGCTSQSDAERALQAEGYENIQMTGYSIFSCSEDDFYRTGFSAVNQKGRVVTGTVCSGLLFKSATIRY